MKTLSMLLCLLICIYGLYRAYFYSTNINDFVLGSLMLFFGAICFLLIAYRTEKIKGYNKNHWMNK